MKVFALCLCLSLGWAHKKSHPSTEPNIWALLVAGSNNWFNYRHQADLCHAYQVLNNHGVPDENIVVMMYDDIANNIRNPTPGIIINHPNGQDVYNGVPKDYIGEDVTPRNFLNVLQGNEEAMEGIGTGKVIKSGPGDHVFVNFVDHGATGLVAFPKGELTVNELHQALMGMYNNNQYGQMVLYIEACESGSMFRNTLPSNINIYATTAANYNESSYACYYDRKRQTYLGDLYSVNWMENSDKANLRTETLLDQFKLTRNETNTSKCQEYGDLRIAREPVADFQGETTTHPIHYPKVPYSVSPSHEAPLDILFRRHLDSSSDEERQNIWMDIQRMQRNRRYVQEIYRTLVKHVSFEGSLQQFRILKSKPKQITQFDCHDKLVHAFSTHCFNFGRNPYALKYAFVLANICEEGFSSGEVVSLMKNLCKNVPEILGGIH